MTLIDKIVHYIVLLLVILVFELVYLDSEVEEKVTLFCIISILVLLTHIYNVQPYSIVSKCLGCMVSDWYEPTKLNDHF